MRDVWRRRFQAEGRASAKTLRRVVGGEVTEIKGRGTFVKKPFMAGHSEQWFGSQSLR